MSDNENPQDPLGTLKNIQEGKAPSEEPVLGRYVNRSDAELKNIAMDFYHDKIFCDRFINHPSELIVVFLPIIFMDEATHDEFFRDLGMIFEYYSKSQSRGYNGYPTFMSMQRLDKTDSDRLIGFYDEYKAMQDKIKSQWGEQDISTPLHGRANPSDYNEEDNY